VVRDDQTEGPETETDWPGDERRPRRRSSSHYLVLFGLLGATASIGILALAADPDSRGYGTHEQLGLPPCRMMDWTGVPCPGCGVTTSVTLAAQGHPLAAFWIQPFGLLTVIALPLLSLWAVAGHFRGQDLYRNIEERRAPWVRAVLVLMALAWIYKIAVI
jgi:hypothetical protein